MHIKSVILVLSILFFLHGIARAQDEKSETSKNTEEVSEQCCKVVKAKNDIVVIELDTDTKAKIKGLKAKASLTFQNSEGTEIGFTYRGQRKTRLRLQKSNSSEVEIAVGDLLTFVPKESKDSEAMGETSNGLTIRKMVTSKQVLIIVSNGGLEALKDHAENESVSFSVNGSFYSGLVRKKRKKMIAIYISDLASFQTFKIGDEVEVFPSMEPSELNRFNKKTMLGAVIHPFSDFFLKYGVAGGYYLSPKMSILGSFHLGSETLPNVSSSSAYTAAGEGSTFIAQAGIRYFFGNSFNMQTGIGYRSATLDFAFTADESQRTGRTPEFSGKIEISGLSVLLAIGNQWSMDNGFFIGVDWLKIYFKATGGYKFQSEYDSATPTEQEQLDDIMIDAAETISNQTYMSLFDLSIGWQF